MPDINAVSKKMAWFTNLAPPLEYNSLAGKHVVSMQRRQAKANNVIVKHLLIPVIASVTIPIFLVLGAIGKSANVIYRACKGTATKADLKHLIAHITAVFTIPFMLLSFLTGKYGTMVRIDMKTKGPNDDWHPVLYMISLYNYSTDEKEKDLIKRYIQSAKIDESILQNKNLNDFEKIVFKFILKNKDNFLETETIKNSIKVGDTLFHSLYIEYKHFADLAVKELDSDAIKLLINVNNLERINEKIFYPLINNYYAALRNNNEKEGKKILEVLKKHYPNYGTHLLDLAIQKRDYAMIQKIINSDEIKPNLRITKKNLDHILENYEQKLKKEKFGAAADYLEIFEFLLDKSTLSQDEKDELFVTAVKKNLPGDALKFLLNKDNVNNEFSLDASGWLNASIRNNLFGISMQGAFTALTYFTVTGNIYNLELLLTKNPDKNIKYQGKSALEIARYLKMNSKLDRKIYEEIENLLSGVKGPSTTEQTTTKESEEEQIDIRVNVDKNGRITDDLQTVAKKLNAAKNSKKPWEFFNIKEENKNDKRLINKNFLQYSLGVHPDKNPGNEELANKIYPLMNALKADLLGMADVS